MGWNYIMGKPFYVAPQLKLYFNDIEFKDDKMNVIDRINKTQLSPGVEFGFIF